MRNIKLTIEYDGTDYAGWQAQNSRKSPVVSRPDNGVPLIRDKKKTIQETMENALHKILHEKTRLIVSGRTDAGVHALGQVANFKTKREIPLVNLQKALNSGLPGDIVVKKAEEVRPDFHSRFDAKSKVYCYRLLNRPYRCALLRRRVYFYPYPLNIGLMRKEARCLLGRHDFKSFCASAGNTKDTVRTIKRIQISPRTNGYGLTTIDCTIEADGFLYNMARNIVGTLVEAGRGKMPAGSVVNILKAKDRRKAGPTMPAEGLCLMKVTYR